MWVVLIAGSTGSALRAVRPPKPFTSHRMPDAISFTPRTPDVAALQLPADNHQTVSIHAVNLKNRLGDVETNCRNLLYG
jgi:hypothetical protein